MYQIINFVNRLILNRDKFNNTSLISLLPGSGQVLDMINNYLGFSVNWYRFCDYV